ncbi:aminotransferase class V-fold PLP-dependent enzyme [Streptomyces phaeoluteigriseus]
MIPEQAQPLPDEPTCPCGAPIAQHQDGGPLTITEAQQLFMPGSGFYMDTATCGLPPCPTALAMTETVWEWTRGQASPARYHGAVEEARRIFGGLVGVPASHVATGPTTAYFTALVAASLPPGMTVLATDNEFTSLLWPFLVHEGLGRNRVRYVPLKEIANEIDAETLVIVSATQSMDGAVADLEAIAAAAEAHDAWTLIDATQAFGCMPLNAGRFTFLVCHPYKWGLCPRGAAFMTVKPEVLDQITAYAANWCGGANVWESLYGPPLRLATDARKLDLSPAWPLWPGVVESLRFIERIGIQAIHRHDVDLANAFRAQMGIPLVDSPIVSVKGIGDGQSRLERAGLRASVRGGGVRLSFHVHNTDDDVARALEALRR